MWIAKNSVTGKTYGKKFKNVYSCQAFIDKELLVLEYEMQRCFALERDVLEHLKSNGKNFLQIIQDALNSFAIETGIQEDIKTIVEFSLQGKSQKELDVELHSLACARWQRNNIIRCYETEQERFADGFDF